MTLDQANSKERMDQGHDRQRVDNPEIYDKVFLGDVFGIGIRRDSKTCINFVILISDDGHWWPVSASWHNNTSDNPSSVHILWMDDLRDVIKEAQDWLKQRRWA